MFGRIKLFYWRVRQALLFAKAQKNLRIMLKLIATYGLENLNNPLHHAYSDVQRASAAVLHASSSVEEIQKRIKRISNSENK